MALTDGWLKANHRKSRDKIDTKADRDGLSARVSAKGKITFQLRYRYAGKPARLDLGTYPLMTLKAARDETHRLRAELEQGRDPRVVKKTERLQQMEAMPLEAIYSQWHEVYAVKNKKQHDEIKKSFDLHIFPHFGSLPPDSISVQMWMERLDYLAKHVPSISVRILTNGKQMLSWAQRRELVANNPLASISGKNDLGVKKNKGSRALSNEEICFLWMAIDQSRMARKNKILMILCLFWGCRVHELRDSLRSDFDFERMRWTVPADRHKTGEKVGKDIVRPIIPEVVPLLEEAISLSNSAVVFPNRDTGESNGGSAHLSLPYNVIHWLKRHLDYDMKHWSIHDLRRTARTNFSTLTAPHIAEIMLGHVLPGEWETYDQHDYLSEQAAAYTAWWERLMNITEGADGDD